MEEAIDLLAEGKIELENTLEVDSVGVPMARGGRVPSAAVRELRSRGHTERAWARTGDRLTSHGFTARLYERVTFSRVNTTASNIARGMAVTAISATLGVTAAQVAAVVQLVVSAGQLVAASRQTVDTYRIGVWYAREGRIDGYRGQWATDFRDLQYDVLVGPGERTESVRRFNAGWRRTRDQVLQDSIRMRRG